MRARRDIEIKCAPAAVWRWLVEPELNKQWISNMVEIIPLDSGAVGVGTRSRMRLREGRRVMDYDEVITRWEPARRLTIEFRGGSFRPDMVMEVDYTLTPAGGGTRLDFDERVNLTGYFRLLAPIFWIASRGNAMKDLGKLKALCEGEGRAP